MFSLYQNLSNCSVGKYSSEDAALRAAINTIRLLGCQKATLFFQKTGEIELKSENPEQYLVVKPWKLASENLALKNAKMGVDSDGRFSFAGRPSNNGWYRSGRVDEIDKTHPLLSRRHRDGLYTAAFVDRSGIVLKAFNIEAREEAGRRTQGAGRGGVDVTMVALQLSEIGRLGNPPENSVALFVLRGNGAAMLTLFKRYAAPTECAPGTAPQSRVLGEDVVAAPRPDWYGGENEIIDAPSPKKRGAKPKSKAVAKSDPRQGTLSLGRTPDNIPLSTKPYSLEEKAELERKFREENGG